MHLVTKAKRLSKVILEPSSTDMSLIFLILSPTPFHHCWEQHRRYQWHQTTTGKCLNMARVWTWCWLNQTCVLRTFLGDDGLLQPVPNQRYLRNSTAVISSCHTCRSKQALQRNKTPRRERPSYLGSRSFCRCNVLVKISTRVYLHQYQANYSRLGAAVPA